MTRLLEGKSALVTGAGSGIGRATAIAMAREGARVTVADLAGPGAGDTVAAIRAAGGEAQAVVADVTRPDQVAAMVDAAVAAYGRLDCAHNNAGVAAGTLGAGGQRVGDIDQEVWDRMIAVNLTGVWLCMKHELAAMERTGGGAIVNTASIAGLVGLPGTHAYVAAKHGVVGLTKAAAIDHAEAGIRVNAICPGYIETPMIGDSMARRGERILARAAMRRLGQPEEIAEAVVWLCSDRSGFVTGTTVTADGGYTAS
ncbi:SDR family oxidoreductase [Plastoroseomonas hellenica]|uniref:SDR family oxidoreductase n=1 Tax=Plastoroseomonas hellenica TaxID=2687306 RepID=UPI001BADAC52|nr:SDR family oxidoreductase [Plastoroseomonas hellenica]MBR0646278.1 SDR family oxidoreductase [Plastoroseomonas hellenica]